MKNIILAIETSCDDTSIAIVEDFNVIALKTNSQIEDHSKNGGVIPELASRLHSENIFNLINITLAEANKTIHDITQIAVTQGPGLVNALQVGVTVAKTLSATLKIPVYGINHIEAHIMSPFIGMKFKEVPKAAVIAVASGGHTLIGKLNTRGIEIVGSTKDDAIGEAYDKVSKILKLGYPGGPVIDELSNSFIGENDLKAPVTDMKGFDFSYSGIKSWVLKNKDNYPADKLANAFQTSAVMQLTNKIDQLVKKTKYKNVVIGGGVSANSLLRKQIENDKLNIFVPKLIYTGDNAAMIGYTLAYKLNQNKIKPMKLTMDAKPRMKIGE